MNAITAKQVSPSFSSQWWDDFYTETSRMTVPKVINNVLDDDVLELRVAIYEMLQDFKNETEKLPCRTWVDGKLEKSYTQKIADDPIKGESDLLDWQKRHFGDKKFGIILNDGQRYSALARKKVIAYLEPLFKDKIPFGGINFSIFIGNYGWTPLGIHQDHVGSFVTHLHLGPGDKTMYMWEENNFIKNLGGVHNEKNAEKFAPFADYTCHFKTGDLFFMPWNYYHIGNAPDLHLGLTVWFNYTTVDGLLNGLWESAFNSIYDKNNKNDLLVNNFDNVEGSQVDLLSEDIKADILSQSVEEVLYDQLEDYTYALSSNSWYDRAANKNKNKETALTMNDSIQLNESPVIFKTQHNSVKMFHRGNKLSIHYHDDLPKVLNEINQGAVLKVEEIISNRFEDWPEGAGVRIIEILCENDIINKI